VNTKTVGEITEAVAMAEFVKAGFPVLLPFGENQRYDMVIEADGRFLRVQCKTARLIRNASGAAGSNVLAFNATSHDGHRARQSYRDQADVFAVYSPHTKQVYVLGVNEVGETTVWLRLTPAKNNQSVGVRYAEEHTLATWVARLGHRRDDQALRLERVRVPPPEVVHLPRRRYVPDVDPGAGDTRLRAAHRRRDRDACSPDHRRSPTGHPAAMDTEAEHLRPPRPTAR